MPLMLPHTQMGAIQSNLPATPSTSAPGTTVTASGTVNTKGSWSPLVASTNFDVCGISISIVNDSTSATQVANLYDIGVGAAASEVVIISNLLNTSSPNVGSSGMNSIFLPIFIPKGTRIAARKQSNVSAKTGSVLIFLHGGFDVPPWKTFSGADGIGVDTADSGGFTHTPGNSGAESTWTDIGSTLARQYGAMMPIVSSGTDTTMASTAGHVEFGISSTTLAEYLFGVNNTEFISGVFPTLPFYGNFPTGTQMMMRAEMAGTSDTDYEFALLGLY